MTQTSTILVVRGHEQRHSQSDQLIESPIKVEVIVAFRITIVHLPEGPRAGNAWIEELVDQIIEAGHTAFEITSDVRRTHPFFARGTLGQAVIDMIQRALDERIALTSS